MNDTVLWYTTRGSGAVSLVLLSAVLVLGILSVSRFERPGWPRFLTPALHRNLALTAVVFVALHVVTAVVDPFAHLGWLSAVVPFDSYYRPLWLGLGTISAELIAAVVITSLVRRVIGHVGWRAVHWLAYASWPLAIVHAIGTGTDNHSTWMLAIDALCGLAVLVAVAARLLRSWGDPLAPERTRFRGAAQGTGTE